MSPGSTADTAPPGAPEPVSLVSIAQACGQLGVARSTFYALVAADQIKLRKVGAASRVRSDELAAFIAGLPTVTVAPRERR